MPHIHQLSLLQRCSFVTALLAFTIGIQTLNATKVMANSPPPSSHNTGCVHQATVVQNHHNCNLPVPTTNQAHCLPLPTTVHLPAPVHVQAGIVQAAHIAISQGSGIVMETN